MYVASIQFSPGKSRKLTVGLFVADRTFVHLLALRRKMLLEGNGSELIEI